MNTSVIMTLVCKTANTRLQFKRLFITTFLICV